MPLLQSDVIDVFERGEFIAVTFPNESCSYDVASPLASTVFFSTPRASSVSDDDKNDRAFLLFVMNLPFLSYSDSEPRGS